VREGLCASSVQKTRGVRLYFCAQMGANTASCSDDGSVTYREVFERSNLFAEISGPKNR